MEKAISILVAFMLVFHSISFLPLEVMAETEERSIGSSVSGYISITP